MEDLVQVASVALVKAVDKFDLDRDVRITAYLLPTVVGELKRHFRDRAWAVNVPRGLKEAGQRLSSHLDELTAALGRSPTIAELAAAAGMSEEEALEALEAGRAYSTRSLSATIDGSEDGEREIDTLRSDDPGFEASENRMFLAEGLDSLPERERRILQLRFFEGLTQTQIASELGISQMHVSRLLRKAVDAVGSRIEEAL